MPAQVITIVNVTDQKVEVAWWVVVLTPQPSKRMCMLTGMPYLIEYSGQGPHCKLIIIKKGNLFMFHEFWEKRCQLRADPDIVSFAGSR